MNGRSCAGVFLIRLSVVADVNENAGRQACDGLPNQEWLE
jgi:hypothetical protein